MSRHFPGLLKNPTEPGSGLRVTLVLSGDAVEIESNDLSLGWWKCTDIDAARSDGNWFQLEIDDEDWRFLPDTPTEFLFYAVPHFTDNGARSRRSKPRFRIAAPDLVYVGRIALGAVLAVFLLSIGMLMGRYRWDNSSVAVLVVLVATAGSGAWWTVLQHKGRSHETTAPTRDRAPVLQPNRKRSALSVREVMATAHLDKPDPVAGRPETEPEETRSTPDRATTRSATSRDDITGPDEVDWIVQEQETPEFQPASTRADPDEPHDDQADTEPHGETDITGPDEVDWIVQEQETPEFQPASTRADPDEPHDDRADTEPAVDQPSDDPHFVSTSPGPISSSQEPASDEGTAPEEPTSSLDLSISVAELIDKTADVVEPAKLVEKPADRAKEASPIDLTAIRGIGPALSAALTQLGVTDVRDLAILDTDDLAYLERRLGRFASRNRTRQWVAQAQRIVAEHDTRFIEPDADLEVVAPDEVDAEAEADDVEAVVGEPESREPMEWSGTLGDDDRHPADAEPASEEASGHRPAEPTDDDRPTSPDPSPQERAPDGTDLAEPASDEGTAPEEPTSSLDLSISVAELIDKTADVVEPAKLVEKPADRAKEASPIDLTAIRGIGPALSAALTQLGVTDVRDLAILDTDDLAYLERRLGRFASRNRTRQWVAQAQRIVAEQDTHDTYPDRVIDG